MNRFKLEQRFETVPFENRSLIRNNFKQLNVYGDGFRNTHSISAVITQKC